MVANPNQTTNTAARLALDAAETVCTEHGSVSRARWIRVIQTAHREALWSLRRGHGLETAMRAATIAARCALA